MLDDLRRRSNHYFLGTVGNNCARILGCISNGGVHSLFRFQKMATMANVCFLGFSLPSLASDSWKLVFEISLKTEDQRLIYYVHRTLFYNNVERSVVVAASILISFRLDSDINSV